MAIQAAGVAAKALFSGLKALVRDGMARRWKWLTTAAYMGVPRSASAYGYRSVNKRRRRVHVSAGGAALERGALTTTRRARQASGGKQMNAAFLRRWQHRRVWPARASRARQAAQHLLRRLPSCMRAIFCFRGGAAAAAAPLRMRRLAAYVRAGSENQDRWASSRRDIRGSIAAARRTSKKQL